VTADDNADVAADLERARMEFHRLLAEAERHDAWAKPTGGTRWTNEQLLFHMVFGHMIVQRLLILVRVFSRLPDQSAMASPGYSTPQHDRSISSTITGHAQQPWCTTAAEWARRWIG
jgi:hypothetical protein